MFDFSFGELALIVLVALLVVGPKDMPVVMRTIGRWVGQFRGITDEFRTGFRSVMEGSQFKDFEGDIRSIHEDIDSLHDEVKFIRDEQGNLQRVYDISDFLDERERKIKITDATSEVIKK